jgi:hypothetical protein
LIRVLLALAAAAALVVAGVPASAGWMHGAVSMGTCPMGTNWGDGCSGAPADGVVQFPRSRFFDTSTSGYVEDGVARQSSQPAYASKPFFNMAGVDFPVGYSASAFTGKAPASVGSDTGNVCTYSAHSSTTGGPIINCDNSGATITLAGYDFGPNGPSGACVPIELGQNFTGTIIFKNDNFMNDPNCMNQGYLVQGFNGSSFNIQIIQSKIDGGGLVTADQSNPIDLFELLNTTGTITVKYSAFLHSTGRPIATGTSGSFDIEDNYVEGMIYTQTDTLHGEFITMANAAASGTQLSQTYLNNTILQPANVTYADGCDPTHPCGVNAPIWMTSQNLTLASFVAKYNTTIVNQNTGHITAGNSLFSYETSVVTAADISYNFTDDIGADFNMHASNGAVGNPGWLNGNVCMQSGAQITAWEGHC